MQAADRLATYKVLGLLALLGFTSTKVQILTSGSKGNGAPAARRQGTQAPAQMTTPAPAAGAAGAAAAGAGGAQSTSTPRNVYKCLQMCPRTTICCYICVCVLLCMRPHRGVGGAGALVRRCLSTIYVSTCCYICCYISVLQPE